MTSRTLRYFLGLLALLAAHWASAVGLGEFKLLSAMDEPLRGEIALLNIGDLNEAQIVAKLASSEDFKRSGVEREFQLTDLRFKVDLSNRANPVIRVTSQRPIKEPYLNFLVELHWTSGRLLREYTTLLDLPVYAGAHAPGKALAAAPPAAAARPRLEEPSLEPPRRALDRRAPRAARPAAANGSYRVQAGDTLWNIATRNQAPGVTVQQTMQAIVAANPEAFIRGNPNLIRRDAVLALPDAATAAAVDSHAAFGQKQADLPPAPERPVESRTRTGEKSPSGNQDGELRLTGGATTGTEAAARQPEGGTGAARTDLGAALEEKDRLERENSELKARVTNLEEQVKAASRLVEISDPGLAALQSGTQNSPAGASAARAVAPDQPAEGAKTGEAAVQTAPAAAQSTSAPAPVAPPPAPAVEEKPQDALATLRAWLVPALGIAGALLLLVMGAAAWRGRTQQQGLELPKEFEGKGAGLPQFNVSPVAPVALDEVDLLPEVHGSDEGPDQVLEEVDVCLSFGNEQQARELLTDALERYPAHAGLHLKMLELLVREGDRPGCDALLPKIRALGDPRAVETATALLRELPAHHEGTPGEAGSIETAEEAPHPTEVARTEAESTVREGADFDLDLDLDLDLPEAPTAPAVTAAKPQAEIPANLEDFDLGLLEGDLSPEPPVTAERSSAAVTTAQVQPLDGDLDLLEPGQEMATQIELAEAYVDMGDAEGAREILDYVLEGGDEAQKESARRLLARLG